MGDGLRDRIGQDPDVLFGKPVIMGTRIPVASVLEYLADNPDFDELIADYPRLTIEDVKACFVFAQTLVEAAGRLPAGAGAQVIPRGAAPAAIRQASSRPDGAQEPTGVLTDSTTLWERVQALEGESLPTMSGRAMFDVSEVDDERVRVVARGSGKQCTVERRQLEQAVVLGLTSTNVTPNDLRGAGVMNPTCAAAIIRAIASHRQTT